MNLNETKDHPEIEVPGLNPDYQELAGLTLEEGWDTPTECYLWEFNHVGNNLDRQGKELESSWEKLSINLQFILDSLKANKNGLKAYRYISKGGRGYIVDIEKMTLTRLGINDVPLKAWEMRKTPLDYEERKTRIKLYKYQKVVYSSSKLEVTEISTKKQRFDIKGFINIFWQATDFNSEDIKDENLEELSGKTYYKMKRLEDRKLNVPISLSNPIRNTVDINFSSSATYYKRQKVIHLVIKIMSATLHEDMSLKEYPFDRQFLNVALSCRRIVRYKKNLPSPSVTGSGFPFKDESKGLSKGDESNYLTVGDEPSGREKKKSFFTSRSLEMKHSGWKWTTKCPKWLPVSSHYHLIKIPAHTKLQGSVADEWKMMRPWCDYAWGLFMNTNFIRMRIERHVTYQLSHTVAPLFMIVTAAFGAFFVPIEDSADRLSVSLTALLTAVAFQFNVASQLPDAGYNTAIDKYILFAFFTLFVVIIENMFMSVIALKDWDSHEDVDVFIGFFMYGIWVIYNVFFCMNTFSWRRIGWYELSRKELALVGGQLFTSTEKHCREFRKWGVLEDCENIHPQAVCGVDRSELIEETKRAAKVQYHRQPELTKIT
jgi:hypothetical protein